jgi:hypothetical protein
VGKRGWSRQVLAGRYFLAERCFFAERYFFDKLGRRTDDPVGRPD